MKLWFVNRYFLPDESATSQLLADLYRALGNDFEVRVVTSRCLHDEPDTGLEPCERDGRSEVHRVWSTRFGRAGRFLRLLDYLSFHCSVGVFLVRRMRRGDVVVLKTDPPLLQLVNTTIVRSKGGSVVNWLQDIYPEVAERLGLFPGPAWFAGVLRNWRDRALARAVSNIVVSRRMANYLERRGVRNVRVITNWADGSAILPVPREDNALRADWGLDDRFVVMYSGNFGRVHAFDDIMKAMKALRERTDIVFVFVGTGAEWSTLKAFVDQEGLRKVIFYPFQPRENLRESLGVADLHLVTLKPAMENFVMPSKLYGALAAGRPVAFVGEPGSAIAELVREQDVGLAFEHGDGAGLASAIAALSSDPERCRRMGQNARRLFEARYTRERGIAEWTDLLARMGEPASVP